MLVLYWAYILFSLIIIIIIIIINNNNNNFCTPGINYISITSITPGKFLVNINISGTKIIFIRKFHECGLKIAMHVSNPINSHKKKSSNYITTFLSANLMLQFNTILLLSPLSYIFYTLVSITFKFLYTIQHCWMFDCIWFWKIMLSQSGIWFNYCWIWLQL